MTEELKVGQRVKVSTQSGQWDGEISTIGRKWVTVKSGRGVTRGYRFDIRTRRLDSPYGGTFFTLNEWADQEREALDERFLHDQGIRIDSGSLWTYGELAAVIREARHRES